MRNKKSSNWKPGTSGNPAGRRRGSKNKTTQVKELLLSDMWENTSEWINHYGLDKMKTELEKLTGVEYVKTFLALLEYFKPKLARVDNTFSNSDSVEIIRIKAEKPLIEKN